ncbi:MAG: hypothetical protein JSW63_08850 [Ignavibacterium sp.]|nr:MAG: hypothetical protein JSW63_08850 [Ignavibacterium sp.]
MNRNKFFSVVGLGMIGVFMTKIIPFKFTSGKKTNAKKVNIKINPLAVKREKVGGKNV